MKRHNRNYFPSLRLTLQRRDDLPVQQVSGIDLAVLPAADDVGIAEAEAGADEAGADTAIGVEMGIVDLGDGAVAFVVDMESRVERRSASVSSVWWMLVMGSVGGIRCEIGWRG